MNASIRGSVCFFILSALVLSLSLSARAFDPPIDTAGPLTAELRGPGEMGEASTPFPVQLVIRNGGAADLAGTAHLTVIDDWTVEPAGEVLFTVPGGGESTLEFRVVPGLGSYNALYPVHGWVDFPGDDGSLQAHPVLIVEMRRPDPPAPERAVAWESVAVTGPTSIPLWRMPVWRSVLAGEDGDARVAAPGVSGVDGETRAFLDMGRPVSRGPVRESIVMHPPWQGDGFRSILVEFPLELPDETPLILRFANAIRDHQPSEPPSDGVTFRVRVASADSPDGALGKVVFDRHTDAKVWEEGEADLSPWAGRSVRLQLESHPGPRNDTTCDESYWGAPTLHVGSAEEAAAPPSNPPIELGVLRCGGAEFAVSVRPGALGLLDATVTFRGPQELSFTGFPIRVAGYDLSGASPWVRPVSIEREDDTAGHLHINHRIKAFHDEFNVAGELWMGQAGLQVRFRLDPVPATGPWRAVFIEDASAGPWNRRAEAVFAGQGNVLVDPGAFTLGFDGHRLATSFVGFDFGGISMVQAVDGVPDRLDVDPEAKRYTLHAPHGSSFTFIPCPNVWEGAKAWRGMNGLKAAPGVPALAGRFVFDLWGGRYGASAAALERAFRYGLTDSVVVWHNWQRWGYDYRLPDIYPPNPALGTEDEFRALADLCRRHGVLFAPHDNYIDYYPDAEGYSYTKIAFDAARRPIPAWFNPGRKAQAYRWRPDAVHRVIARNIDLLRAAVAPTAYFIDVWSSAAPHDYWTHDGRFHDRLFTRNVWGREFAWIRDRLGGAPQISESGHDALIGWLDGAQTNHLRVWRPGEPDPGWMAWEYPCADAERVPWFDAAHHDRFVLHGAGYGNRYAGGLDMSLHGIYSDDYIATEVLTAHPAMVSEPFGRDVVRKYWLLHDLMRALALQPFESHEFGSDIHRQHVTWEDGETWVNRSPDDWDAAGRILPPYGFYARAPQERPVVEAAVERRGDRVVEWSRSPVALYGNARPAGDAPLEGVVDFGALKTDGACRLTARADGVYLMPLPESRPFTATVEWEALPWPFEAPRAVEVLDESGAQVGEAPLDYRDGVVTVSCDGEAFAYRLAADMKREAAF